ncbi:DUF551 domain-containing protein [Cronobacter turicensis]|nr:DUF551 domain-containing protein [Cronobacter turicensis]
MIRIAPERSTLGCLSCRYFTSVVSGSELPATHWMPLPEAPTKN